MSNPYDETRNDMAETLEALKDWIKLVEKRLANLEKKSKKKNEPN